MYTDGLVPRRVAVLMGGDSSEREVSLASGACVAQALTDFGHQVTEIDPAESHLTNLAGDLFDACFIALHGGSGENGSVQSELEELGLNYTGSGPRAARLAMSKSATRNCLNQHSVNVPRGVAFPSHVPLAGVRKIVEVLGFPLVVKPDGQGCSLGVSVAPTSQQLAECIRTAGAYESLLVAETLIAGREFTLAVIDREPLPALEIMHGGALFDYQAKFGAADVEHRFVEDRAATAAQSVAVAAAAALKTRGLVRVDVIVDNMERPFVLEVNTIPGMTSRSLAPMAARRAGIDMPQLCNRLVQRCIAQEVPA